MAKRCERCAEGEDMTRDQRADELLRNVLEALEITSAHAAKEGRRGYEMHLSLPIAAIRAYLDPPQAEHTILSTDEVMVILNALSRSIYAIDGTAMSTVPGVDYELATRRAACIHLHALLSPPRTEVRIVSTE